MAGQFKQYRFWATSWIVVVLVLVQFSGCSRFTSTQWNWFAAAEPTDFEIPERILPIWTDTVLHQPNQKGVRGFGGRLYFYSEGSEKPIPVDGNVTVYVFDGDYSAEGSSQPLKKYVIKAEQLKTLGSHSTLGYSYSTWIPWEEVGGPSRKLNLITRFDGVHGGTVISSSSTKLLPGVDTPAESVEAAQQESPRKMGVVQAGYLESEADKRLTKELETTIFSIELPSSLERRINGDTTPELNEMDSEIRQPFEDKTGANGNAPDEFPGSRAAFDEIPKTGNLSSKKSTSDLRTTIPGVSQNSKVTLGKVGSQSGVSEPKLRSHFESRRFPVRNGEATRQSTSLLRKTPHPAGWQSGLPPTPRSNR